MAHNVNRWSVLKHTNQGFKVRARYPDPRRSLCVGTRKFHPLSWFCRLASSRHAYGAESFNRTVSPDAAERRAASRISITTTLTASDDGPEGFTSPRTIAVKYD